jgi:hypothetical protein
MSRVYRAMSQQATSYLESHNRLSNWNDELEFLGYILSEIVDPRGLEEKGFPCHQAADLPAIIDTLQHACSKPDRSLRRVLSKKDSKYFEHLLLRCKQIRNAMAHHWSLDEDRMRILQEIKGKLSDQFQSVIRLAASRFDIHQVCIGNEQVLVPCAKTPNRSTGTVMRLTPME